MFLRFFLACGLILPGAFQVAPGQEPAIRVPPHGTELGQIEVRDPLLDSLIDPRASITVLAEGFTWSEGPVWVPRDQALLFSDVPRNRIYRWHRQQGISVFLDPSGRLDSPGAEREPGTNGLCLDAQGRLLACDHGNRRLFRLETDGRRTTLADRYQGHRFHSPNDLVRHPNGDLFFTDPPYGLRDESKRELDFFGVYRLAPEGQVTLLIRDLVRPNGIGLSPDQTWLYVAQSHQPRPVYMKYPLSPQGEVGPGQVLFDASQLAESDPGMPDGMALDAQGNLWATGPGGVLILTPEGKLLGRILLGQPTANCAFGEQGQALFITSGKYLLRVPTRVRGLGFASDAEPPTRESPDGRR